MKLEYAGNGIYDEIPGLSPIRVATLNDHFKPDVMDEYGRLFEAAPEMLKALIKIANWELPATGKFWDREEKQPMSYEAANGSNGARDYIKSVAKSAIEKATKGNLVTP